MPKKPRLMLERRSIVHAFGEREFNLIDRKSKVYSPMNTDASRVSYTSQTKVDRRADKNKKIGK